MIQLFASNIIPQLISRVVFIIVTIITTGIIARDLGPERYGYYTIIFVYLTFVAVLTDIGLQTIAVRESARYDKHAGLIIGTLFWIKIFLTLIISTISAFVFLFSDFHPIVKTGFAIAMVGQFFIALTSIPNTLFQSKLKIKYSAISEIIGQLVFLSCVIVAFLIPLTNDSLLFYILFFAISSFITFFVGICLALKTEKILWLFDMKTFKFLIKETLPLSFIIILSQIHFRGDSLLLSLLKPEKDVGIYGLSFKFFEAALIIPLVISTVILPLMSKQSTNESINEIASKCFYAFLSLGVLVCLFIVFFSSHIIKFIAGIGYEDAVLPTKFLGLAVLFGYINNLFVNIVIIKNRQKDIVAVSIAGVTINLIMNILFIPEYSYNACAIIKVISEFFGMSAMGYLAYNASRFNPLINIFKRLRYKT